MGGWVKGTRLRAHGQAQRTQMHVSLCRMPQDPHTDSHIHCVCVCVCVCTFTKLRSEPLARSFGRSSCALCNVCANHEANKRQAREVGALPVLVHLLSTSQVSIHMHLCVCFCVCVCVCVCV